MSNVAIKLIAVSGVVGLGLLMFLQAQKGMQTGEIDKQLSQLEVQKEADLNSGSLGTAADLTGVPTQVEPKTDSKIIPLDQVPAELSELTARDAAPIKKDAEIPFTPNRKNSTPKIRLTGATKEPIAGDLKSSTVINERLEAPVKGLDFRSTPETKAPRLAANPFSDSVKNPTAEPAKNESTGIAQTEFKTGPQFGTPTTSDPARMKGFTTTSIPPREKIPEETKPENPFDSVKTKPTQPSLTPAPDQLAFRDELPKTEKSPAFEINSPAQTLESNDSPFEIKPPTVPDTPSIEENPFQSTPAKPDSTKKPALPATQTPAPAIEPEFNPFESDPAAKKGPAFEAKPADANPLPIITENKEKKPTAFPGESAKPSVNPFPSTIEKKPIQQPLSEDNASDVVVIKKRKADPSPKEPLLFNLKDQPAVSSKTAAQPIEISPTPEPKPLSLVESQQPELQAPVKPNVQQKIQSPKMTIQKLAPPEAVLGQPFIYQVLVKNTGTTSAQDVVVEDRIPQGAKLTGTIPRAEQMNNRIIWRLGTMDPGTEKKISIRVIPEAAGQIGSVATVNFVTKVASETKITAPQLTIKTDQPAAVKPGEITVVNYTITNSGSGDAKNVYLRSIIPPQFTHPGGDDLEYSVGIIPAGETKQVQLKLKAIKPGAGKNISSVM
nr:DUF11 domain-containing protein [Planctomycetota bacterium]